MYEHRFYRDRMLAEGLVSFRVVIKETDLYIAASRDLTQGARTAVLKYRRQLEGYITNDPRFATSYAPVEVPNSAPEIVKRMAVAAKTVAVGPMAAVAGAIAEYVGRDLLAFTSEVIVENGGDIFLKITKRRRISIYAGQSPLSNKIALGIEPNETPLGVCTSAGTVGHSVSFGRADAVVVVSSNTCLADAAATAIGNRVHEVGDIEKALAYAQAIEDLKGVVIIKDDKMGVWGAIKIVPLGD